MAHDLTSLNAALKLSQDKLKDLKPNVAIIQEIAKYKDSLGREYEQPVVLSYDVGFTFGDSTCFSYEADVAGVYAAAKINSTPVVLKTRVAMSLANRMMKEEKTAETISTFRSGQLKTSIKKMQEIELVHGKRGVAVIDSTAADSSDRVITFKAGEWSAVFAGMEKAKLEARRAGALVNTNADLVIKEIKYAEKQIVVSGNATDLAALAQDDVLYFKGAYANGQYGLLYQLTHSGTVFGINNTTSSLWKANTHAVSGPLTMKQVLKGAAVAIGKGLDSDAYLFVSPDAFEQMNTSLAALAQVNPKESSKIEIGSRSITYRASFGLVEVVSHPYFKESEAALVPKNCMRRIGEHDVTFGSPTDKEPRWEPLPDNYGIQLTTQYSLQLFVNEPGRCVIYTGISSEEDSEE